MNRRTVGVFISLAFAVTASGQFVDNFSSSVVSGVNWGGANLAAGGFDTPGTTSSVVFSQCDPHGRTDFMAAVSASAGPAAGTSRGIPLLSYFGSYDSSWSVQVDVSNGLVPNLNSLQLGLLISNTAGISSAATHDFLKAVVLVSSAAGSPEVHGGIFTDGTPAGNNTLLNLNGVSTSGTLRIDYNASTHVFSTYYNSTPHSSFGITGSGGTGYNANWNMINGTDGFVISLFGQAVNNSTVNPLSLTDGIGYLDNFSSTGLTAAPIPEPSTSAIVLGVTILAVMFRRRQPRMS